MQLAYESFVGSDANPIGGNWTTLSGATALQRKSNVMIGSTASGDNLAYWNGGTWPNNQWAEIVWNQNAAGSDGTVLCRLDSAAAYGARTYYSFDFAVGYGLTLGKNVGGPFTALGTNPIAWTEADGDVFQIRCVGTTISGWLNGVQQVSVTDSAIASGRPGLYIYDNVTGWGFKSFAAGDFGPETGAICL